MSEVSVAPANGFDQNTTMLVLVLLRCDVAVDVYSDICKATFSRSTRNRFHSEHSRSSRSSTPSI